MYILYEKENLGDYYRYTGFDEKSLFGCNNGLIPWMLNLIIPKNQNEPYAWFLDVNKILDENGYPNMAMVIDIKPKNTEEPLITLCELSKIWGFSNHQWTPMMFGLNTLIIDEDINDYNKEIFQVPKQNLEVIYSFLYAQGSITDGKITGKWIAPKASPTNSALLWPESLSYFIKCIGENSPELFK